jgi:hypothetical protein
MVSVTMVAAMNGGIATQVAEQRRAEKACDDGTQKRKEDDCVIHDTCVSPS